MKISSDWFLTNAKKPNKMMCEDYVIVGCDSTPYLIITDGCSSSSFVDIGARILAHSAKSIIENYRLCDWTTNYHTIGKEIIKQAASVVPIFNLPIECLDSTLIIAIDFSEKIGVLRYGDGFIFRVNKNNELDTIFSCSFKENAPYYLSYYLSNINSNKYKNLVGEKARHETIIKNNDISEIDVSHEKHDIVFFDKKETSCLLISTDGIDSLFDFNNLKKINYFDVLTELTSFKSKDGAFLKRRCKRAFEDYAKNNIYNTDDVAIAALMIEEEDDVGIFC